MGRRPPENVQGITDRDWCIGCGACLHICPFQAIQMRMDKRVGFYGATVVRPESCVECNNRPCLAVCPSYKEDFVALGGWENPDEDLGPLLGLYTGHSKDESTRQSSSSGGVIRECCRHLLETRQVDGIITMRHDRGLSYLPHLYQSSKELFEQMPCSIYHNVAFDKAFEIVRTRPGSYLLIALPCQLTAFHKWLRQLPETPAGKVVLTVGLICGWMYSWNTPGYFARSQKMQAEEITDVSYRGGDAIGSVVLRAKTGALRFHRRPAYEKHAHASAFRAAFSRAYASPRCLICVEHMNYLADVALGDAWINRFESDPLGESLLLVRTPKGMELISALRDSGRLDLQTASPEDVVEAQNVFAKAEPAELLLNWLRSKERWIPEFKRPFSLTERASLRLRIKNHYNPMFTRAICRLGAGYAWFCARRMWREWEARFWQSKAANALRWGKRNWAAIGRMKSDPSIAP